MRVAKYALIDFKNICARKAVKKTSLVVYAKYKIFMN